MPPAFFIFKTWLANYAFRIQIGWWFAAIPVLLIFSLASFAVLCKVIPATGADPVKALRYE
jgi:putative ABC transport system permease protein